MPIVDDQIALLQTARNALHGWQGVAQGVDVTLQQVVMIFPGDPSTPPAEGEPQPPAQQPRTVTFTWDSQREKFSISM